MWTILPWRLFKDMTDAVSVGSVFSNKRTRSHFQISVILCYITPAASFMLYRRKSITYSNLNTFTSSLLYTMETYISHINAGL